MREILFRGQTRRYGEKVRLNGEKIKSNWVYGGIFPQNGDGDFAIIYQQEPTIEKYPVYADTVGQYTDMVDKHGTKIFEGDILAFNNTDGELTNYEILWFKNKWVVRESNYNAVDDLDLFFCECSTVIGNIYDNPELLGDEENDKRKNR